ncbi:trafficking protein particle complex subunit 31 [Cochliomyia hominivorax]
MEKLEALKMSSMRPRTNILDRPLSKGKSEVSQSIVALLFSEIVQYSQSKVNTVPELQNRLHEMGQDVGTRIIDLYFMRERSSKRETKLTQMLLFVKTTVWKNLFGKEAEKLEKVDDERTYYIIEKQPLVNTFISVPKDKGTLNCANFTAGIVEAVLTHCGFPCKVTAHWHNGTTYMVKFEDFVIARDKQLEDK